MPPQPDPQGSSRSKQIAQSGRTATKILRDIADATKSSYLKGLAGAGTTIFETLENVKSNKEKCLSMTEQAYELLCAVINCCEDAVELAPAFLHSISVLTSTLHKVVSFIGENTGGNLVKRILHHQQTTTLMEECMSSLQHALALFKALLTIYPKVQSDIMTITRISEMQAAARKRHIELLEFINQPNALEDLRQLRQSTSSVSVLLPPVPKIIHGRRDELDHIINALCQHEMARVAILGPGGIGKTSLAQATLHDSNIVEKFSGHRYWITCDSSESANDLKLILAAHFGVVGTSDRLRDILISLQMISGPVLLILDNLETPWEQPGKRLEVEELLSHLTGVENLSLMITMRGAERPGQIQWTRPFLPPLGPITLKAAQQTFVEISDADETDPQLQELLLLMDGLPLVVSLMASVAEAEGCAATLARWKTESTALLSEGISKQNNLEKSIEVSLHSARFNSTPAAKELLSILSYLPDGVTSSEFTQIQLPFSNFQHCRSILCRTSLAYVTNDERLKLLAPIKEYIQNFYPPPPSTVLSIRGYFVDLVKQVSEIYKTPTLLQKFIANIGNIHFAIRLALSDTDPATVKPVLVLLLNLTNLYFVTQISSFDLILSCSEIINHMPDNSQLLGQYCFATYWTIPDHETKNKEAICLECIEHYNQASDMIGIVWAYLLTSRQYCSQYDYKKAITSAQSGIDIASQNDNSNGIAWGFYRLGVAQEGSDQYIPALRSYQTSQDWAHELGDIFLQLNCLIFKADCHAIIGNLRYTSSLLTESTNLIHALGLDGTSETSVMLVATYAHWHYKTQDFLQASDMAMISPSTLTPALTDYTHSIIHNIRVPNISQDTIHQQLLRLPHSNNDFEQMRVEMAWASYYLHRLKDYKKIEDCCYRGLQLKHMTLSERATCIRLLGDAAVMKGSISTAEQHFVIALAYFVLMSRLEVLDILRRLGDVYLMRDGDEKTAFSLFEMLLETYTARDIHGSRAECMIRLADLLARRGAVQPAKEYLIQAIPLFECSLQEDQVQLCQDRIALLEDNSI
ncbi:hypothetical protein C8J56DRAFT_1113572 [Mycena floridula]|nr:hypothetical protein C8J56DRAFT_1113572 [Mycena floridula]